MPKVPTTKVSLIPPLGAGLGLPFTVEYADEKNDPTSQGGAGRYNRDGDLLANEYLRTGQISIQPMPSAGAIQTRQQTSGGITPNSGNPTTLKPVYESAYFNMGAPSLNYGMGQLEFCQLMQHSSRSLWDASQIRSEFLVPRRTYSQPGRYTSHKRRFYTSSRAGNYSSQETMSAPDVSALHTPIDQIIGTVAGTDAVGYCTNANFNGGARTAALTHFAKADLPSNGFGLTYGDAHNTIFASSLHSHPLLSTTTEATHGIGADGGGLSDWSGSNFYQTWGVQWSLNQHTIPQTLSQGTTLSATDACMTADAENDTDKDFYMKMNTIQSPAVRDIPVYGGTEKVSPIGATQYGNHVVADTCGLVGFEGTISVTGFFSVSAGKLGGNSFSEDLWNTEGVGYGGLNVQIHSGLTHRRNRLFSQRDGTSNRGYDTIFRYGSDGTAVQPMTDAMKTRASRFSNSTIDANSSSFYATRTLWDTKGSTGGSGDVDPIGGIATSGAPGILGDMANMNADTISNTFGSAFLKNRIPTKVKIVPQIVGYENVTVQPGSSKGSEYPSQNNIVFRKPIVDYHVLVSVIKPTTNVAKSQADTGNNGHEDIGTPTSRNAPAPRWPTIDANYDGEPCNIFHAVFRINPTNLEQIYIETSFTDTSHDLNLTEKQCEQSVLPRHNYDNQSGLFSKTNQGWGLHQITPFRPISKHSWSKIPKLCGTVEPGGFYQRGGISHLWDADGYGGELFVSADMTDASDFNSDVWGNGQMWPDGDNTAGNPPGSELMIFKYSGIGDPYYTKAITSMADNPLRKAMVAKTNTDHITGLYTASMDGGFTITDEATKTWRGWSIHDWVFPQKELMRYLGREDKGLLSNHPSLHCSALSIQEDGRMLMAAIQRDVIVSEDEFPFEDIGFPLNPDISALECPSGFYYDPTTKTCVSIMNPVYENAGSIWPGTGDEITGLDAPRPSVAADSTKATNTPPGNNFSRWPTWTTLKANSKARSLILLFSNTPASGGKLVAGRAKFDITTEKVGTQTVSVENWTFDDTWWNGSQIAWWYQESGQRAIPITYGSYPEARCSHAVLPRTLPHLMADGTHTGGYPQSMPIDRVMSSPSGNNGTTRPTLDSWATDRRNFLLLTRYISTTIGFSDFGLGMNPHQEVGWAGWSMPNALFDPIDYGDGTDFFQETNLLVSLWENYFPNNSSNANATRSFIGPRGGFSHFGPLHYGISSFNHPYKTDTIWTQVHGGVGYDLPLHLLIPPAVHVRARSGGNGSLDLELELPFHRTDTIELDGAIGFNSGFDKGPENLPDGTRPSLGNYSLSTQLWNDRTLNAAGSKMGGYDSAYQRIHGPIIEGTGLTAFWGDHPTDRFHASAIPIMPPNTYSHAEVETNMYAPMYLGRANEYSRLDQLAISEQLQSSTEVHINQGIRPFWDSGSMVSARGVGSMNDKKLNRARFLSEIAGEKVYTSPEACVGFTFTGTTSPDAGLGKGQRILRTPEGTLHQFLIERSGQASSSNMPMWTHYKQPTGQDLFWNSKALKIDGQNYDGKDEVGPLLETLTGSSDKGRVLGSAFASDSDGTIHAVLEYTALKSDSTSTDERAHRLYYTYAKRTLESHSPTPVYDWDWTAHTPQLINAGALTGTDGELAGTPNDLRHPSLVCDASDRLHLAFTQVVKSANGGSRNYSAIWYMNKLKIETTFPAFVGNGNHPVTTDSRVQLVSPIMTSAEELLASTNTPATLNQKVIFCDMPKICLRGDGVPVVFYRGDPTANYSTPSRRFTAIYVNRGAEGTSSDAMGRIKFDTSQAVSNLGYVLSGDVNSTPATDVIYYDAIIDEKDRAYTTAIWGNDATTHRATQVNTFDTRQDFLKQYSEAKGLGTTRTLYATTVASNTLSYLSDVTMTSNGDGQIHMIFGFSLQGATPKGKATRTTNTTQSLISPLQVPATPISPLDGTPITGDGDIYDGGYTNAMTHQNFSNGGSYPSSLKDWEGQNKHFLEVWMPSFEWSQAGSDDHWVIRSVNMRWLSVPDLGFDSTNGWFPIGSASGIAGSESFPHQAPQLRYQRYNGFNASALDLAWLTNEMSWNRTPLPQSSLYLPGGGTQYVNPANENNAGGTAADEIPGYPI